MSSLVGMYRTDGVSLGPNCLRRALEALSHPGFREAQQWQDGPVALGHIAFVTTLEAEGECFPAHSDSGRLWLTADCRLDNREYLRQALSIRKPLSDLTDSSLILAGYERWGVDLPRHLEGPFAIIIWDEQNRSLFVARDHVGIRPLYYALEPEGTVSFASRAGGLLAAGVSSEWDWERVADYVADIAVDSTYTFYRHIKRLPPGHRAVVTPDRFTISRYWSLDPEERVRFAKDKDYAVAFRALFDQSIACRLRTNTPVGATLSGGLDSSSVAVVAQSILSRTGRPTLRAYSNVWPLVPECDERPYIDSVLHHSPLTSYIVRADLAAKPLTILHQLVEVHGQPFSAPSVSGMAVLYSQAAVDGTRVVLDGHGGDEVVSYGRAYLRELALNRRWRDLYREVSLLDDSNPDYSNRVFFILLVLLGLSTQARTRGGAALARRLLTFGRARLARSQTLPHPAAATFVHPDLAESTDLPERVREFQSTWGESARARLKTEREDHYRKLTSPLQPLALEELSSFAAAWGLERRHPFWDRRLVQFCYALPADQKRRGGLGRSILRRSLTGMLPDEVRLRTTKTEFTGAILHGLMQNDKAVLDELLSAPTAGLEGILDGAAVSRAVRGKQGSIDFASASLLIKLATLQIWKDLDIHP